MIAATPATIHCAPSIPGRAPVSAQTTSTDRYAGFLPTETSKTNGLMVQVVTGSRHHFVELGRHHADLRDVDSIVMASDPAILRPPLIYAQQIRGGFPPC